MVALVVLRVRAWASSVHDGQLRAASAVLPHTGRARARYTSGHGARARMAARLGVEGCDALDVVGAIPNPSPTLTLTLTLALALALTLASRAAMYLT